MIVHCVMIVQTRTKQHLHTRCYLSELSIVSGSNRINNNRLVEHFKLQIFDIFIIMIFGFQLFDHDWLCWCMVGCFGDLSVSTLSFSGQIRVDNTSIAAAIFLNCHSNRLVRHFTLEIFGIYHRFWF